MSRFSHVFTVPDAPRIQDTTGLNRWVKQSSTETPKALMALTTLSPWSTVNTMSFRFDVLAHEALEPHLHNLVYCMRKVRKPGARESACAVVQTINSGKKTL